MSIQMTQVERDAYIEEKEKQLDYWRKDIETLAAEAREADKETKLAYEAQLAKVRAYQREAEGRLERLKEASDEAWSELQSGVSEAWHDLEPALDEAQDKLAEKG